MLEPENLKLKRVGAIRSEGTDLTDIWTRQIFTTAAWHGDPTRPVCLSQVPVATPWPGLRAPEGVLDRRKHGPLGDGKASHLGGRAQGRRRPGSCHVPAATMRRCRYASCLQAGEQYVASDRFGTKDLPQSAQTIGGRRHMMSGRRPAAAVWDEGDYFSTSTTYLGTTLTALSRSGARSA
jgi:hypothetical protein